MMKDEAYEKHHKEFMLQSAKNEIAHLKAMKLIAMADNDAVSKLEIGQVSHAFSTSQIFIPLIEAEIKEIQKAIKGKPNKWE